MMASRARKVKQSFSAKELYRIPPHHEAFEKGDKVVVLRLEDGQTVFMRRLEKRDPRPSFIVDKATFTKNTKSD